MQKLNLRYTQFINKKYDRTGRLWKGRYFSSLVDKEKYLWAVARYIKKTISKTLGTGPLGPVPSI